LHTPSDIVIHGNFIYVSNCERHQVIILDLRSGEGVKSWGVYGKGDGQLYYSARLTMTMDGESLIMTDHHNGKLQWFQ